MLEFATTIAALQFATGVLETEHSNLPGMITEIELWMRCYDAIGSRRIFEEWEGRWGAGNAS